MTAHRQGPKNRDLLNETEQLRARLAETEEILRAIRCGEVDAFFVADANGERVITLEGAQSAYRALVEAMNEGAAILQHEGLLLYCNGRLAEMLKAPLETVMGTSLYRFAGPAEQETLKTLIGKRKVRACAEEITFCCHDGTALPVRLSLSPMHINGKVSICAVVTDLTEHKRIEAQLRSLSLFDELTGLYNRRGFFTLAQQQLKLARRQKGKLLLVFIDLDNMKPINDNLGHSEGDRALTDTAAILKATFRESDLIARLGGDEFAILATVDREEDSSQLILRLQRRLAEYNAKENRPYRLSMSVGMVFHDPEHPIVLEELLVRGDAAMYEQKRAKRSERSCPDNTAQASGA
jgi:diguanylate cyclase (GGDEF)-like protein/PAS domain S-box-containing protein